MKFDKDDLKSLGISLISNFIFQSLISLIPSISLTAIIKTIISKSFQINVYVVYIILTIIFFLIEFIIIFLVRKLIKNNIIPDINKKKNNQSYELEHTSDEEQKENEYANLDYYFEDYNKHLTVYKNGNGIIINSFTLIINDINSIIPFKRELNIEDAQTSANFPSLRQMKGTNLKYRFEKFCFKCKCINNKDLISSVEEKYWTDDSDNDDISAKNNPKHLKWILKMNPSSVEPGKPYRIVYVISIPRMFPIENGIFKESIANKKGTHGYFNSSFSVKHKIKKFIYTVSFEDELKLYQKPSGKINCIDGNKNLHFVNDNNLIYDRYIFSAENLSIGSAININWCFKETQKGGGKKNEQTQNEK